MNRNTHILVVAGLCGMLVGCIPLPRKTVARYGVEGRLTDAATGEPIAKRHVSVKVDGQKFDKKTNRQGEFKAPPDMYHFWTWLGGPWWPDATRATVEITFVGYAPYHRTFVVKTETPDVPLPPDYIVLNGNYITLGEIGMKRREQDGTARSQTIGSGTNQTASVDGSAL
jgi:hypothetical protein